MTFDVNDKFSLYFTREYKAVWKENLAVYQKSLRGFCRHPFIYALINWMHFESKMYNINKNVKKSSSINCSGQNRT